MMPYDYSDAPPPRDFELIPDGVTATLRLHIKPGGVGEDGMLRRSSRGDSEFLDGELTVIDGQYAKRKIWVNLVLDGTTPGQQGMALSNRGLLKLMLDSALGLRPDDISIQARAARTKSLKELEGVTFIARIGIERGKAKNDGSGEKWPDKNCIAAVITPDKRDWHPVEQPSPFNGGSNGAANVPTANAATNTVVLPPVSKPSWAS
jgi:hypothetical protein